MNRLDTRAKMPDVIALRAFGRPGAVAVVIKEVEDKVRNEVHREMFGSVRREIERFTFDFYLRRDDWNSDGW